MKKSICIDYMSFEWSSDDLVQSYRELKRQQSKTLYKILIHQDINQLKRLCNEKNKQSRYENVLWRKMAKSCTANLSHSNALVSPCTLNWQRDSDITWLYGPLYVSYELSSDNPQFTHPSLLYSLPSSSSCNKLKPILKKRNHKEQRYWRTESKYWSKCASELGKQNVRFNPDIIEIQYIPEVPITHQNIVTSNEEEDSQELFPLTLASITFYIRSFLIAKSRILVHSLMLDHFFCMSLVILMCQTVTSFMYQVFYSPKEYFTRESWLVKSSINYIPSFARKNLMQLGAILHPQSLYSRKQK